MSSQELRMYGSDKELDKLVDSEDWQARLAAVKQGYGLDKLVNDKLWGIRLQVAKRGYGLDKLVNDGEHAVRKEVAKQGYGLDVLINDWSEDVRKAVAEQSYSLDVLVKDWNYRVRAHVARQGYGLDKLINDEHWVVRAAVAEQGYGLDILIDDRVPGVVLQVVKQGHGLDKLISYRDDDVRETVAYKLDGKTIVEWWESAPKKSRYYKDVKSMPEGLQTTFAVVATDAALGGERTAEHEMWHGCGCKRAEKVMMDVTHSYGNGFSIKIHFFQSSDKYTITLGFPDSVWGDIKAEFSSAGELISLLRSAKSRVPGASEEFTQALSKAINAVENLIS